MPEVDRAVPDSGIPAAIVRGRSPDIPLRLDPGLQVSCRRAIW
ncbi:MAG: hypothetical protein WBH94_08605 [Methanoculleus sp.]